LFASDSEPCNGSRTGHSEARGLVQTFAVDVKLGD